MVREQFLETIVGNPPDGWTLGHVTLTLHGPEERIPVEAWRSGAFAIHEGVGRDGKEAVLTHAPTGLRIHSFATMDDAAECAEKIERLTDWCSVTKRFDGQSDLYPRVRDVVEAIKKRALIGSEIPATEGTK